MNDVAILASLNDEPQYYTKDESDNKYALKSDAVNVDLTEFSRIDQVNEVLTENYKQKTDLIYGTSFTKNITIIRESDTKWSTSEKINGPHIIGSVVYNNNAISFEIDYVENHNTWYTDNETGLVLYWKQNETDNTKYNLNA